MLISIIVWQLPINTMQLIVIIIIAVVLTAVFAVLATAVCAKLQKGKEDE